MARKEFETLTPQMYYILLVLLTPKHGYDIDNLIIPSIADNYEGEITTDFMVEEFLNMLMGQLNLIIRLHQRMLL